PSGIAADTIGHGLPTGAMTLEVSVLQFDAGAIGRLRDEPYFDLAGAARVGFQLPGRPDVPRENQPRRRFESEHSCPFASTAVNWYASNAWLQNMSSSDRSASMPSLFTR